MPGSGLSRLPDELVLEILRQLPTKTLNICICLSKASSTFIWDDPTFMRDYYLALYDGGRGGGLLFSEAVPSSYKQPGIDFDFYYLPLLPESGRPKPFERLFSLSYKEVTNAVNGLVCAYDGNRCVVYNIFTWETMPLPDAPAINVGGVAAASLSDAYYFGYDPVDRLYKLLKISVTRIQVQLRFDGGYSVRKVAHILSLGHGGSWSWRQLHIGYTEPAKFPAHTYLFNGVLYWVLDGRPSEPRRGLLCFDVKSEKFHFIRISQLAASFASRWDVTQFKGRLALYDRGDPDGLVIYTLDSYEHGSAARLSSRTRNPISFPPGFTAGFLPVGNLHSGQILLPRVRLLHQNHPKIDGFSSSDYAPVYSYDHRNNKFEKFIVGKLPPSALRFLKSDFRILYTQEENVAPLNVLLGVTEDIGCG